MTTKYNLSVGGINRELTSTLRISASLASRTVLDRSVLALSQNVRPGTSYEEYKVWVTAWKRLYRDLSECIVNFKNHRDGRAEVGNNVWETIRPHRQSDVMTLKGYATHLLTLRAVNKIMSARSREAVMK